MKCSLCSIDLEPVDLGQATPLMADKCPSCGGTWLERSKVSRLGESARADRPQGAALSPTAAAHGILSCPSCAVSLDPLCLIDVEKLVVDRCPECAGLWLDVGELSVLAAAIKRSGPRLATGAAAESSTGGESRTSQGELIGKLTDLL